MFHLSKSESYCFIVFFWWSSCRKMHRNVFLTRFTARTRLLVIAMPPVTEKEVMGFLAMFHRIYVQSLFFVNTLFMIIRAWSVRLSMACWGRSWRVLWVYGFRRFWWRRCEAMGGLRWLWWSCLHSTVEVAPSLLDGDWWSQGHGEWGAVVLSVRGGQGSWSRLDVPIGGLGLPLLCDEYCDVSFERCRCRGLGQNGLFVHESVRAFSKAALCP